MPASQEEIAYLPAAELVRLYRARELSPIEVLEAQLDRADALALTVNALTWRFSEEALIQAHEAETRYLGKGSEPRPLEGITLAIKEEMPVAGQPVTNASRVYADAVAEHTAPLAERAMAAGAIVHARTTQPEFACVGFTQSDLFGITRNPWNLDYDVGGSSGGAGAALASGLTTLAGGSDIGGSIRIPAACCGVVGFKPPYGRVPQLPPFNLDHYCHEGPLSRTVADCALFENIISGPSPVDIASQRERVDLPLNPLGVSGLRVALTLDLGGWEPDDDVRRNTLDAADALRDAGAVVEEVQIPIRREDVDRAATAHYATIFGPSIAAIVAEHREVMTPYAVAFGETMVLENPGAYLEGLEIEGTITGAIGLLLERHDALICPTLTIPALPVDSAWSGHGPGLGLGALGHDHLMTIPFNIASRCPVLNVPSGFATSGVPTGLQLVGRTFEDEVPFRLGAALERAALWDYATRRPALPI
jgi:Asp-tRNA(Asn)/Glu-tRNA(Gln) amidotransferase A subunit family amidase